MLKKSFAILGLCLVSGLSLASNLTVYSVGPNNLITVLAQDYQAATGVRVQIFQGTTGQVMSRLEAEQRNPIADVVISASWDSAVDLKQQDLLAPLRLRNMTHVPDSLKDSHYIAQGVSALSMVFNTKSGLPQPEDWFDVTAGVYRNQVTMPDPAQSGTAFELLSALLTAKGDDATWDFLATMKQNRMIVPGPNARALNPVLQGAKSVVFGAVDYIALGHQARGESIEVIFPPSGTVIAPRPMMVLASSRNQDRAMDFVDFVLSEAGQARVAEVYLMSARTDIKSLRPGINDLNIINIDENLTQQRQVLINRFRAIMD
ncbi:extracellular solute-binding protein [Vibrio metschnikovii]|uniref:extracellular solute-binding protein n=1 Tax=Vibrio metschnikovii TaxID=28172 RepID=UPI001C30BC87|nr:extracellular solute-binding protein [Vibrio metschnikovii]